MPREPFNVMFDFFDDEGVLVESIRHSCPETVRGVSCHLATEWLLDTIPPCGRAEVYSIGPDDPRFCAAPVALR